MNAVSHLSLVRQALAEERRRQPRDVEETAFLPAALEVIERPVSPTGRLTTWVLLGGLILTLAWMAIGRIDIVATAQGKVIPADNVKLVQPAAAGVVRRILVQDGQRVRRGQPLVELDPTQTAADSAQAGEALDAAKLDVARARAVLAGLDGRGVSFVAPGGIDAATAERHRALAVARYQQLVADQGMQAADARAAQAAVGEARRQAAKLAETLPLLDQQIAANETLLAKGYVSKLKVIEMRRTRMAAARDRDIALQTAARANAQAAGAGGGVARSRAAARATVLEELVKAEAEVALRREAFVKSRQASGLATLTAPVSGTVAQLAIHTEGGVVEAAKPIMLIVPSGGGLAIEAQVLSRDAGFVRPGMAVAVKLDAFPFNRHGSVPGRVVRIGSDAVEDERLGLVYTARVALGPTDLPLRPGMGATVDVKTGRRSILATLLSPIDQATREAFRER